MKTSPAFKPFHGAPMEWQRNDLRQPQDDGLEQAVAAMEWLVVERSSLEAFQAIQQPYL